MAMMLNGPGGGRRGRRRALQSEINVTPFVDVMLVLLIVFMITAPLLTTGIEVNLPKAKTQTLPTSAELPLSVTLKADGTIYIQEEEIEPEALLPKLRAIVESGYEERIYVRGDESVTIGELAQLLARIQGAGFNQVALVTDPDSGRQ